MTQERTATPEPPTVLVEAVDRCYDVPPGDFVRVRTQEVARLRGADGSVWATRVAALRKPTAAAWAVNLLVRREPDQLQAALDLAEALRSAAASLDGDQLRSLTRQRRQLTTALAADAARLTHESGVRLSGPTLEQVEGMLTAAMLDPVSAAVVRTGRVVRAFTADGVSAVDPTDVVALPEALGERVDALAGKHASALSVVPEPGGEDLEVLVRRRAEAETAVVEAERAEARACERVAAVQRRCEEIGARRLHLESEIDEWQRRVAACESELDELETVLDEVETEREESGSGLAEAKRDLARARDERDSFEERPRG